MKETFPSCPNIHHIYCNMIMQHMCSVPLFEWTRNYSTPLHHSFMTWLSLFAYWLWSCVVTVLILLTKYWCPSGITLLNYFLKPRGITSACWKCPTDGRSISLAATIRPPLSIPLPQKVNPYWPFGMKTEIQNGRISSSAPVGDIWT